VGARLDRTEEQIAELGISLDKKSQSFLDAGIRRRQREKEEKDRLEREEQEAHRKRTRVLASMVTALLIFLIPTLFVAANVWMFYRRQNSDWQYTGFASNSVLSIATSVESADQTIPRICVGTADIGVGCSHDLQNWNVYQVGFPTAAPALLNNRESWLGSLGGSAWSTTIKGIEAIAFDLADPHRIYVSVMDQSGLYVSSDSGATWNPIAAKALTELPEVPTDVRQLAVHDGVLFVLRHSEALSVEPEQRGSLHLSRDNGLTWQEIGGPSTPTGIIRAFLLAVDSGGSLGRIYVAGETGLWQSDLAGGWEWQQLLALEEGSIGLLLEAVDDIVYFATYDFEAEGGAVYRWFQDSNENLSGKLVEYSGAPMSMTLGPDVGSEFPLWLLFGEGQVVAVDQTGRLEAKGRRPGWPWSTAKSLSIFRNPSGSNLVLMGHRDGLLQYCPDGQGADECGSVE
jgi:hypothetical protein